MLEENLIFVGRFEMMELTITFMDVITGTLLTTMAVIGWVLLSQDGGVTTVDLHMELLVVKETDVGHFVAMGSMLDLEECQTLITF